MQRVGQHRRAEQFAQWEPGCVDAFDREAEHGDTDATAHAVHTCDRARRGVSACGPYERDEGRAAEQCDQRREEHEPFGAVEHTDGLAAVRRGQQLGREAADVRLAGPDTECERAADRMGVGGDDPPGHDIRAGAEVREGRLDRAAISGWVIRRADIDHVAVFVVHPHRAEFDADGLAPMHADRRRRRHDRIDRPVGGLGTAKDRVRERRHGREDHDRDTEDNAATSFAGRIVLIDVRAGTARLARALVLHDAGRRPRRRASRRRS